MSRQFSASRLDVVAFASDKGRLSFDGDRDVGEDALTTAFERLAGEACEAGGLKSVRWEARAENRPDAAGEPQPWIYLDASALLTLRCQRCLAPAPLLVTTQRWFRFVADEATAAAEDDESDEDVLAIEAHFNLERLVEDELLMAIPMVPMHDVCPAPVPTSAGEEEFQAALENRPAAFAALAQLLPKS